MRDEWACGRVWLFKLLIGEAVAARESDMLGRVDKAHEESTLNHPADLHNPRALERISQEVKYLPDSQSNQTDLRSSELPCKPI